MKNKPVPDILLYALGVVVLLGSVMFRLRLLHVPIDRDEGEFAYAGWRILHGGVPYLDFYNMKMPGIYAAYAFLFLIFGPTVPAIRLGLVLVNVANTFFVYKLGRKWGDMRTGMYAAICYLVFSLQVELQGTCSHAEHFAMLFVLAGFVMYYRAMEKKSLLNYFWCGLLLGIAFLMKQPAFSFSVLAALMLLMEAIRNQTGRKFFLKALLSMLSGMLFPLALTSVLLTAAGAGHNFILFAFRYAKEYISYLSWSDGWNTCLVVLGRAIKPNLLLWALVPFSLLLLLFRGTRQKTIQALAFLIIAFVAAGAGFYFRPHYFQFILPAVAILAGSVLGVVSAQLQPGNKIRGWLQSLPVLFIAVAIVFFCISERSLFSIRKDEDFIRKIYGLDFFNATKKAADFIAENSAPGAKVAIFGAEPEIWFYAKRLAASGYLYVYPLLENQKFALDMRSQFYDEILKSKPDILVYTSNMGTWYASETIHDEMYQWYKAYRDSSFRQIGMIDMLLGGPANYYWTEKTGIPVNEENYIEIYKRKE